MGNIRKYLTPKYIIAVLLAVFLGCAMFFATYVAEQQRAQTSDYSEGWTTKKGDIVDTDDLNTGDYDGIIVITKQLPNRVKVDDSLCFISANANVTVFVDGRCEYRFSQPENFTGWGYGTAYHAVNLSTEAEGKIVKIVLSAVFKTGRGGHIRMMSLESSRSYFGRITSGQLIAYNISVGIMFIGLCILFLRIVLPIGKNNPSLVALGIMAMVTGAWLANDTGFLRLAVNAIRVSRVGDYVLMHLSIFTLMIFMYSMTKERRRIYLILACALFAVDSSYFTVMRYVFGIDMASLEISLTIYFICAFILVVIMLVSDSKYCSTRNITRDLRFFFGGLSVLFISVMLDFAVYLVGVRSVTGRGNFCRVGFCVFFVSMGIETLRVWSHEQESIRRDRFINKMLQYAVSASDPDTSLNMIMDYFGREYHADHVFLYENRQDGYFHLTYEWFREDAPPPGISDYRDLPYEGLVRELYEKVVSTDHYLIVDDSDETRLISPDLYDLMKRADISNMVVGALERDGELMGLFGIDDAPRENSKEIADITWLLSYFLTQLIIQRDDKRNLERMSFVDSLTGAKNRRALDEYENDHPSGYPYGYIMCDINGLKKTNDSLGHSEGDELIKDVAASLIDVFGHDQVFRMGGDEFVAYSYAGTEEAFELLVRSVRARMAKRHRSASIGKMYVKDASVDKEEVKQEAEKRMYEEKKQYYRDINDRRGAE